MPYICLLYILEVTPYTTVLRLIPYGNILHRLPSTCSQSQHPRSRTTCPCGPSKSTTRPHSQTTRPISKPWQRRCTRSNSRFQNERERIDVWGMPLPVDMSNEDRVARCMTHMEAEIASRESAPADTVYHFHIPQLHGYKWLLGFLIIDRPQEH